VKRPSADELRAREFYEKPTAERKTQLAAAIKRHHKRLRNQLLRPSSIEQSCEGWTVKVKGKTFTLFASTLHVCTLYPSHVIKGPDHRRHENRDAREGCAAPVRDPFAAGGNQQREVDERKDMKRRRR